MKTTPIDSINEIKEIRKQHPPPDPIEDSLFLLLQHKRNTEQHAFNTKGLTKTKERNPTQRARFFTAIPYHKGRDVPILS